MNTSFAVSIAAFLALATPGFGQVLFIERFEDPDISTGGFLEIPTGPASFDNPDWLVTNVSDATQAVGVFIDDQLVFNTGTGQVLAFGGGQSPTGNRIERLISGFTGTMNASISFDFFNTGAKVQGIRVDLTDPGNGENVLYSQSFLASGQVTEVPFAVPTGDVVRIRVSQIGSTTNSDSAIDNIRVTSVLVPEPTSAMLTMVGLVSMLGIRRRR